MGTHKFTDRAKAGSPVASNLEQITLLRQVVEEQQRTNDLLKALVDMRSAELVDRGYQPHPFAR
jgi:hypothetical protein